MQLTASHQTTIRLVKRLGEDFDSLVKKWCDSFIPSLSFQEVKNIIEIDCYIFFCYISYRKWYIALQVIRI